MSTCGLLSCNQRCTGPDDCGQGAGRLEASCRSVSTTNCNAAAAFTACGMQRMWRSGAAVGPVASPCLSLRTGGDELVYTARAKTPKAPGRPQKASASWRTRYYLVQNSSLSRVDGDWSARQCAGRVSSRCAACISWAAVECLAVRWRERALMAAA